MPTMNFQLDDLKHALIAVCIGVAMTFVTDLAHVLIHWLQGIDPSTVGGTAGATAYMLQAKRYFI